MVEPFDFETIKADTLKVIVKDVNGNKDTATVIVNVKNVNENPELRPNDTLTVPENCKSCIAGIITAIDPDGDPIKYTVKEPGFIIDSDGVLKLTEPVDYEKTQAVTVTVIAEDPSGTTDTAAYKIRITDINDLNLTSDTKWVQDFKGNNLLLFTSEWCVNWALTKNPDLRLREFNKE